MRHLSWRFYNHICEISVMETKCRQITASLPLGLLEEVLRQAGIPLLRSDDERTLITRIQAYLVTAEKEQKV
nr:hypothetical protein 1772p2_00035 [Serratia proteamaculans]